MTEPAAAAQRARRLTDADGPGFVPELLELPTDDRAALVWALKDECVHAWTAEPPRTQRCAGVLLAWGRHDADPAIAGAASWCEGLAHLAGGRMEAALSCLDRAHECLLAVGQDERAAQSQIPKVIALTMLGRHDEALACGGRTLAELVAAGDDLNAGKVELNLGWMLLRHDRHAEAEKLFRRAASRFARVGDGTHSILADIGLASALTWQFDFDEALRLYERSTMRARVRGLTTLLGVVDSNRGRLELHRGRHELALRALEAALQEAERDGMPQDVAEARRDLADAYLALNLLPEAIALYDQTIAACEQLGAPVERAWALVQRAQAQTRQGALAGAASALSTARALFVAEAMVVGAAWADLRRAELDLAQGDPDSARQRAGRAAAALHEAGIDGWACEADIVAADALAALDDCDAAHARYARSLEAATDLPEQRAACHTGRGLLWQRQGDAARARREFEQAVHSVELQRAALPGDEFRIAYGADKQRAYDALIELALDDRGADAPWHFLRSLERARAPALRAALSSADAHAVEGGLDPARREQLRWLHEQWREAVAEADLGRAAQLRERSRRLEHEWLEAQRRSQAARGGDSAAARADPLARLDAQTLCASLPDDAALVVFGLVGARLAACVVTREGLSHMQAPAADLAERIEQLRFQIDSLRFAPAPLRRHAAQMLQRARAHLQALHAIVWQPLARAVDGRTRVIVVPHRSLHYLPLGALDDGRQPLLARHEITLAPSVGLWLQAASTAATARHWRRATVLGVGAESLSHVAAEVDAVAAAFRAEAPGHATVLREGAATQAALRQALDGIDVLHLACHGQFRADSPYFSALHLGDGPLTVRDAASLPLHAELVTLSACETALSRVAPGDETLGLLRGFLLGGARRVLATQWTVDDASTALLMERFYAAALAGQRPAAALRAAQLALAEQFAHPYHWAPFVLHERG